jgi:RNA polymerase sigma-70 factor, ECF subfamily
MRRVVAFVTDGDLDRIDALTAPRGRVIGRATDHVERLVLDAYDANQHDLYRFARASVRDPDAAEDIVADAYLRLVGECRRNRVPDDVRGWLFRVAANLVVSRSRRRAVAFRFLPRLARHDTAEAADAPALRAERDRDLLAALDTLPADHRVALLLAAAGYNGHEIAAAIGRSESAVRTLLSRSRVRLRERLQPREDLQ